jgi:anhydro-N-acetylmuramic acid kinase
MSPKSSSIRGLLKRKKSRRVLGIVSGTSADGASAVITEIQGSFNELNVKLLAYKTFNYPNDLREEVFKLFNPNYSGVEHVCKMNFVLGHFFAESANKLITESGFKSSEIDLIGSHGQTVWHNPAKDYLSGYLASSTMQLGEPTVIAQRTSLPVVADFRKADIAAGGEGAPLSPYLDFTLHRSHEKNRVFQNLGGIANLTYLPKNCELNNVIAFDTGPGNMIIDAAVKHFSKGEQSYDKNGRHALRGKRNETFLNKLLKHPYFSRTPPKTTGREEFGEAYTKNIIRDAETIDLNSDDLIATVSSLTIELIAKAYQDHLSGPVDEVYLSGGGAFNSFIVEGLQERLEPIPILSYDELGISSLAKEATLFAILANEHIMGIPSNIPSATGATKRVVLGTLYNFNC